LATDGLLADAGKKAHAELHKVLDGAGAQYAQEIRNARQAVLTVEGTSLKANLDTGAMSFDDFVEAADYAVIEDAYKRAARLLTPDVARTYSEYLVTMRESSDDDEAALIEAHTIVAAMGLVPSIKERADYEAERLSNKLLGDHRVSIKNLSDERQEVYRQIREMSTHPLDVDLARPQTWIQPTTAREADGKEVDLPRFERHLLCDEDGLFPEDFKSEWEGEVVLNELRRAGAVAWYRNPDRASQDSLGVIYEEESIKKIVRPDFIFFSEYTDGTVAADIVDPHGIHFTDALPKLKGLASYAEAHAGAFRRIDVVAKLGDSYRVLDLMEPSVRAAISAATAIKTLYAERATDYLV
jgi:hypothetical protein